MSALNLFLPFTPNGKATELRAIDVKRRLGVGAYGAVDPYRVLSRVPGKILDEDTIGRLPDQVRDSLCSDEISAIGYGVLPATGEWLIFVNPSHSSNRQKVSLMEELVHIALDHPRTILTVDDSGNLKWKRPYNKAVEDEAFCVGAACVIPYKSLFYAIRSDHLSIPELAQKYAVSEECVRYRIKRAGLAKVFGSLAH